MKQLLAVMSCHAPRYRERVQAQRETWASQAHEKIDQRFFLGRPSNGEQPAADEVFLDAPDGYHGFPTKVRAMFAWALANGYDYVFKTDDDAYVNVPRLLMCRVCPHDYVGAFRGPSDPEHPWDYASGFGYWLSRRAMAIVASAELDDDWAEDRWVAKTLWLAGIDGHTDGISYVAVCPQLHPQVILRGWVRQAAVFVELTPVMMRRMHQLMMNLKPDLPATAPELGQVPRVNPEVILNPPKPSFSSIAEPPARADISQLCILIKTFLRDGYLFDVIAGIEKNLPEARMVIVDDGVRSGIKETLYQRLRGRGHAAFYLPFDSGFGAKANAAIPHLDRPYVLVASDDFNFGDPLVRPGIEKMLCVVSKVPGIGVASGRVDNLSYEGFLEYGPNFIREVPLTLDGTWSSVEGVDYKLCDLTVNYSVLRKEMLGTDPRQVRWDARYKIGGEHHDFFQDVKTAGWNVAFVPGANINQLRYDPTKMDPRYHEYRGRAIECVGKFVRKHCGGVIPEHFYYIDFQGESCDYAQIARDRNL